MNSINEIYTFISEKYTDRNVFYDRKRDIVQLKYPDICIFKRKNQLCARIWHNGSVFETSLGSYDKGAELFSGVLGQTISIDKNGNSLKISPWNSGTAVQNTAGVRGVLSGFFGNRKSISSDQNVTELKELSEKNTEPSVSPIKINFNHGITPSLTDSKICGLPYWDPSKAYPVDRNGKKLLLLAQINLSQLPVNKFFTRDGILQFFIPDIQMPEYTFRPYVVYHSQINCAVTSETVKKLEIPEITKNSLFRTEYLLTFTADKNIKNSGCHILGGSSSDPSGNSNNSSYYNFHLLQLDTEDSYMRFHFSNFKEQTTGSFSFFINENDLKSLDFGNVQIRWNTHVWNG